jgi:DNA-binding PadR family transcriptional regulator
MLDKTILGILHYKDLTIYDIKKAIERNINFFYSSSYGSIHPTLKKLETKEMIKTKSEIENGRLKKIYSITKKGKLEFHKWLLTDIGIEKIQDQGLLRLFFLNFLPNTERIAILKNYCTNLSKQIEILKNVRKESIEKIKDIQPEFKEIASYQMTTLDFGLNYYEFAVNWYGKLINQIEKGEL